MTKLFAFCGCLLALALPLSARAQGGKPPATSHAILDAGRLTAGYELGVDTDQENRDWLEEVSDELKMAYPQGQKWGAVFAVVGKMDKNVKARQTKDFSGFHTLVVSMRGEHGGEVVEIGLKDRTDPDNGAETKSKKKLTREYQTYTFPLSYFRTANLQELYVVTEFVFGGPRPSTIFVSRIEFK